MQVSITVCEIDQEVGRETKHYTIKSDGAVAEVDLCQEHAAPLEALLQPKPRRVDAPATMKRKPRKAAATRKRTPTKVVSFDEIEQLKV